MEKRMKICAVGILALMILSTVGVGLSVSMGGAAEITSKASDVLKCLTRGDEVPVWSDEVCLTAGELNHTNPTITIDKEGTLHLAWITYDESNSPEISYMKSSDKGGHWTNPADVYDEGMPAFVKLRYNRYQKSLEMLLVDPVAIRRGNPSVLYQTSYDNGENWSTYLIPVIWQGLTLSFTNEYKMDFTCGRSYAYLSIHDDIWEDEAIFGIGESGKIVAEEGFSGIHIPSIAAWGSNVYAVVPTEDGLNFSASNDNGTTWSSPVKISSRGALTSTLVVEEENLYLIWANNSSGNYELYFKKSEDGGKTWSEDIRLTYTSGDSLRPSLSMNSDGSLNIVWEEHQDSRWEIYFKKVDGDGNPVMDDVRLSNSSGNSRYPEIVTDSSYDYTYVVWQDNRNGKWDIFFRRFPSSDIYPPLIEHEPITTALKNEDVHINSTIKDDSGISSAFLHFGNRMDNISHSIEMNLTSGTVKNGTWEASFIPSDLGTRTVFYYIEANDSKNLCKTPVYPISIKGCLPRFSSPTNSTASVGKEIEISVRIEAEFGVDSAILFYKTGDSYSNVSMNLVSGTNFSGIWEAAIPPQTNSTTITYYIETYSGEEKNVTGEYSVEIKSDEVPDNTDSLPENVGTLGTNDYIYPLILLVSLVVFLLLLYGLKRHRNGK